VPYPVEVSQRRLLADMHGEAHDLAGPEHPPHDLTDRDQLRHHLAVAWRLMRDNRPVTVALFESAIAAGPASGEAWRRLAEDTEILRDHLEDLRRQGRPLPGDPTLVAAAMGGMLSMLAYAQPGRSDDEVIDTLTDLLLHGLAGSG
jgi:hypothetical protein